MTQCGAGLFWIPLDRLSTSALIFYYTVQWTLPAQIRKLSRPNKSFTETASSSSDPANRLCLICLCLHTVLRRWLIYDLFCPTETRHRNGSLAAGFKPEAWASAQPVWASLVKSSSYPSGCGCAVCKGGTKHCWEAFLPFAFFALRNIEHGYEEGTLFAAFWPLIGWLGACWGGGICPYSA